MSYTPSNSSRAKPRDINNNTGDSERTVRRSVIAIALIMGLLLSLVADAEATQIKANPGGDGGVGTAEPFPEDGIIFGRPPASNERYTALIAELYSGHASVGVEAEVLVEFIIGDDQGSSRPGKRSDSSGTVRFIDEGDSVSTVIVGNNELYRSLDSVETMGELFQAVAPARTPMPGPLAEIEDQPFDIRNPSGHTEGFQFDNELIVEEDDWAEGCETEEYDGWKAGFESWTGYSWSAAGTFDLMDHHHFASDGKAAVDLYGYFGSMDAIYFGVCRVDGFLTSVRMQRPLRPGEFGLPWVEISGTYEMIGDGERYLYHNHTHYGPLRRGYIHSDEAQYSGTEFFISGAGYDDFYPDDHLTLGS